MFNIIWPPYIYANNGVSFKSASDFFIPIIYCEHQKVHAQHLFRPNMQTAPGRKIRGPRASKTLVVDPLVAECPRVSP